MKEKLKFTKEQEERRKVVHEAALDLCKVLTEDDDLELEDNSVLESIATFAAERVSNQGHKVHYPAIIYIDKDDEEAIKEYIENGDITASYVRLS